MFIINAQVFVRFLTLQTDNYRSKKIKNKMPHCSIIEIVEKKKSCDSSCALNVSFGFLVPVGDPVAAFVGLLGFVRFVKRFVNVTGDNEIHGDDGGQYRQAVRRVSVRVVEREYMLHAEKRDERKREHRHAVEEQTSQNRDVTHDLARRFSVLAGSPTISHEITVSIRGYDAGD